MSMDSNLDLTREPAGPTSIPVLGARLPNDAGGPVAVMYDASIARPLRLRDPHGTRLDPDAHRRLSALLTALDVAVAPLKLDFLKARATPAVAERNALDAWRTQAGVVVALGQATHQPALADVPLSLRVSLRVRPAGADGSFNLDVDCRVRVDDDREIDPAVARAAKAFGHAATRAWTLCAQEILSPWLIASGVSELRLAGGFRTRSDPSRRPAGNAAPGRRPRLH